MKRKTPKTAVFSLTCKADQEKKSCGFQKATTRWTMACSISCLKSQWENIKNNYGGGYADYVAKNGKKHSFNLAENFAKNKSGGAKVTYTNPIAVSKNGGWRYNYGNMFYVELVNQYLNIKQFSNETVQAVMNEASKYQG